MTVVFRILEMAVTVYSLVVIFRVFMNIIPVQGAERVKSTVYKLTEPYLKPFRSIKFLRQGRFDLSFVAAIWILSIVGQIFTSLASRGFITVGWILAIIFSSLIQLIQSIAVLILIFLVIRLISVYRKVNSTNALWYTLDSMLQPLAKGINRKIVPKQDLPYGSALLLSSGIFLTTVVVAALIRAPITLFFADLPF